MKRAAKDLWYGHFGLLSFPNLDYGFGVCVVFQKWQFVTPYVLPSKEVQCTVVPRFSVLGYRALPGFRALCNGNQIWIYVINLPGFSALPGFKALFHGDGQSVLNPGTTVYL